MAAEVERIKKLFKNNWNGITWHGTNLQEILKDITWQQAFARPAGFNHNIYQYVMHMACWRKFVWENLNGNSGYKVELNSELDWVTVYEANETTWKNALNELAQNQENLSAALELVKEEQLDEIVPGKKFRWYILLHGVIHHDIYHSAQIAILKRANA